MNNLDPAIDLQIPQSDPTRQIAQPAQPDLTAQDLKAQIAALYHQMIGLDRQMREYSTQINQEFEEKVLELAKKTFPRIRNWTTEKARPKLTGNSEATQLWDHYRQQAKEWVEARQAERKALEEQIKPLSEAYEFPPLPALEAIEQAKADPSQWQVFQHVSISDYASQGLGASRYARVRAELHLEFVQSFLPAYIEPVKPLPEIAHLYSSPNQTIGYEVRVLGDEVDVFIARSKPVALKWFVQNCWKKGANVRVYYPFLPHGYEEENRIYYC